MSEYIMPAQNGKNEIVIDRSRFICHVFRVETIEQASIYIDQVRNEHPKANHNCVAYLIGENNEYGKATDDGEPSKTAGAPMLQVLQRQNLKNCLVVVTRYFGGIPLGAGGLIRAYSSAVSEGLKHVGLVRRIKLVSNYLTCDYSIYETLTTKIQSQGYAIGNVEFSDRVKIEVLVELDEVENFNVWIIDFSRDTIFIEKGNTSYKEIKID